MHAYQGVGFHWRPSDWLTWTAALAFFPLADSFLADTFCDLSLWTQKKQRRRRAAQVAAIPLVTLSRESRCSIVAVLVAFFTFKVSMEVSCPLIGRREKPQTLSAATNAYKR